MTLDNLLTVTEKREIIKDSKRENTPECCNEPMFIDVDMTEFWGVKQQHTEYYCHVCGIFFME